MSCIPVENSELSELLGVVLCGGESSRMGTHKALITQGESTWVELCERKLLESGVPSVVFSVNDVLYNSLSDIFPGDFLIKDSISVKGPLGGVLSVFDKFPEHDLLILPCDMPSVPGDVLSFLLDNYKKSVGMHDFIVFGKENDYEPLPGIYSRQGLEKVASLLALGELSKHSLKYVLETGNTCRIALPEGLELPNLNTPEDLEF